MTTDKVVEIDREYPKVKHESDAADAKCVTVRNAEEEAALGDEWLDGHEYWTAQRIRAEKPAELDLVKASVFLKSRGYAGDDPQQFVNNLEPREREGFLKELSAFNAEISLALTHAADVEGVDLAEKEDVTPDVTADPAAEVAADVTADPPPRKKGKGKLLGLLGFALLALSIAIGVPHASAQQGLLGRSQSLNSTPAASAQATVSFPAAPEKWVFDQVCFSGGSTTAPALTQLSVNVRDGATGAGTVLTSFLVIIPAATGQNVAPFCAPLGFTGSFNTAATAEWSGALTNEFEQVTLYVHKAQ